jgi:hypothetical protein
MSPSLRARASLRALCVPLSLAAAAAAAPLLAASSSAAVERGRARHPWGDDKSLPSAPYKGAGGAYTGPFTQLTDSFLDVADPNDGFGPEDKLVACNGDLVFVDLDELGGVQYKYNFAGAQWSKTNMTNLNTCANGVNIFPRDAGYVVGVTRSPVAPGDRLLVLGGDDVEDNVYSSDDCGLSWSCTDRTNSSLGANWAWDPREYPALVQTAGIFPGDPIILAGGIVDGGMVTVALFNSTDGGQTWARPTCSDLSNCQQDCVSTGNFECTLPFPDPDDPVLGPRGNCGNTSNWQSCYVLPDLPVFPGAMATDWNNLWMFLEPDDDGMVWRLGADNYASGFQLMPGWRFGGMGRKVFVKGLSASGQGTSRSCQPPQERNSGQYEP